jgi:hypothetical protein
MNKYLQAIIFVLSLVCSVAYAKGQAIGNEWINYAQQYYKIPVAQTGFYRLTKQQLSQAGFPVNTVNPRRIQLFHRGIEQSIIVNGENDGSFDNNDYIEFYGRQNDGALDAQLYQPQSAQPHQHSNLFSDTTAYFLTWRFDDGAVKRIRSYTDLSFIPNEAYHWAEAIRVRRNSYSKGLIYPLGENTAMSFYDVGEGWFGDITNRNVSRLDSINGIFNIFSSGPNPKLELMVAGRNRNEHRVQVFLGKTKEEVLQWVKDHTNLNIQRAPYDTIGFRGYNIVSKEYSIPGDYISATGNLYIIIRPVGVNAVADAVSFAYVKLSWPQTFNVAGLEAQYLQLNVNSLASSGIELTNVAKGSLLYDITNTSSIQRIGGTFTGTSFKAVVQGTGVNRRLYYRTEDNFIAPARIDRVFFRRITPSSHNYLIVTHQKLMQTDGAFQNPVKEYATYRASALGGGYDTLIMDINLLYDQFNYGEASPLAIKNFASFMYEAGKDKALFLIGKGVLVSSKYSAEYAARNLIPTFGVPASDNLFTTGLNGDPHIPGIAIGRLAATGPEQVTGYLNKVREQESAGYNDLWRKNVLHLSGGRTQSEQRDFRNYIFRYQDIAQKPYMGALVESKFRQTNETIEIINVSPEVNRGVSILTLFGHSSPTSNDMEIGMASSPAAGYNNKGRYPLIIMNGCQGGLIYSMSTNTLNEDWVLTPEKGAISFIAHSDDGIPYALNKYTESIYKVALSDSVIYGQPIGRVMAEAIRLYKKSINNPNEIDRAVFQQFTLHGDPVVRIFDAASPDYKLGTGDAYIDKIDGQAITASSDSIRVAAIVSNFGKYLTDSVQLAVKRILPDNSEVTYGPFNFIAIARLDTLFVTLPNKLENNAGLNKFELSVDPDGLLKELDEQNNKVSLEYYVPVSGVSALFPKEFSVVGTQQVVFKAQSSNLLEKQRSYILEMDTTIQFNSSLKQSHATVSGALPEWKVTLPVTGSGRDSAVYYWRVKFSEASDPQDTSWSYSSFTYIDKSPEGWAQSKLAQHRKNSVDKHVVRNEQTSLWEFLQTNSVIKTTTQGAKVPSSVSSTSLLIDNTEMISGFSCGSNTIRIVAFDKNTLQPYRQVFANVDQNTCGRSPRIINAFNNTEITRETLLRLDGFIDFVKEGDFVLLISHGSLNYPQWGVTTKQKLASLGVDLSRFEKLTAGEPYIMMGKKGAQPGTAIEAYADPELLGPDGEPVPLDSQIVSLSHQLSGVADTASITSVRIGPAAKWQSLFYNWSSLESSGSEDSLKINVFGIDLLGNETVLFQHVTSRSLSLATVDTRRYPYLKLQAELKDAANMTPPQLKYWMVSYEGVPEGIVNAELAGTGVYEIKDKQEGERFYLPFVFQNISNRNFADSVMVRYTLTNQTTRKSEVGVYKLKPLASQDTAKYSVPVSTLGNSGNNILQVFFNPQVQPEEYYQNNVIEVPFKVTTDKVNPILEVAFDGIKIMDGDIISPNPLITVRLKDENPYLLKTDTSGIKLLLKRPCEGCVPETINLNSPEVSYVPASNESNEFIINYSPRNLENGKYHTLSVQGSDAAGNLAGANDYSVNFEVINESTITHFYPYPNPFTTTTRFAFTLTGATIPDDIRIQIMTVTGKVVREIKKDELGPVHVGHNLTNFAWDGTDEFGDKLANGVYLYRVLMKGDDFEHRATEADDMFKKNIGKIYILR